MPESSHLLDPNSHDPDNRHGRRGPRVRIDQAETRGEGGVPGRGSLLGAFHLWGGAGTLGSARDQGCRAFGSMARPERRGEDRHGQVECLAWVGWKTWRGFHLDDALVVNLSRGGARVFLDSPPPRGRAVWVFLETPGSKAVIKARVRGTETLPTHQCAIRVEFREPCPYALFEAAVCGLAAADPRARLAPAPRVAKLAAAHRPRIIAS